MAGIKQIKRAREQNTPVKRKPSKQTALKSKPDTWLNNVIDEHLTGVMTPPRSGVFHPSTLSNSCDKAVWLTFHGHMTTSKLEPTLNRIFQNGSFLEKRVESWLANLGILLGSEIPVKNDNPSMSGRIDFLIKHEEYKVLPVELKSINTNGFAKLSGPKKEHKAQLQMYLNMGNFDMGTVLYENKNDQQIKSFLLERDETEWNRIIERCFNIQAMSEPPLRCTGAFWCACRSVDMEKINAR